ncbi:MAG: hypothetical protein LBJ38_00210 [Oscillospiraceae bacterium]|nr:hypothetical protein [Oscillospiraceae bacterium]
MSNDPNAQDDLLNSAEYKVELEDFISYNLLLMSKNIKRSKLAAARSLSFMTMAFVIYLFFVGWDDVCRRVLVYKTVALLWGFVFLNYIFSTFIFEKWIKRSARKTYAEDSYSKYRVRLELYADRLSETTDLQNNIFIKDVELILENDAVCAVSDRSKWAFIIPKCNATNEILAELEKMWNEVKPSTPMESSLKTNIRDTYNELTGENGEGEI